MVRGAQRLPEFPTPASEVSLNPRLFPRFHSSPAAYGTRNDTLLKSVPLGVTTWTSPVVAPAGMLVVISELDTTVKVAALPLKLTLVAPVRLVPRMLTVAPTFAAVGFVSTNGSRPTDRLKTVPSPLAPPSAVIPYKFPFVSCTSPPAGYWPSVQPLCEQKL